MIKGYSVGRTFIDYPSEEGDAIIVYFNGCEHACSGCQSPSLQVFHSFDEEELVRDIEYENEFNRTDKIVLSGGDPLHRDNIRRIECLSLILKEIGFNICIYTGYDVDFVREHFHGKFDFIKCGVYIKEKHRQSVKDENGIILASDNQDFYDKDLNKISYNGKLFWR